MYFPDVSNTEPYAISANATHSVYTRDYWWNRHQYFYKEISDFHRFLIPEDSEVAEYLPLSSHLAKSLNPRTLNFFVSSDQESELRGEGVSANQIFSSDVEDTNKKFDYILAHGVLNRVRDIQPHLKKLSRLCHQDSRIVVSTYNAFWEGILSLLTRLGWRSETPLHNWLSDSDIRNLFYLENFEVVSHHFKMLIPTYIPFVSNFVNKYLSQLPILRQMCLMKYYVLRPILPSRKPCSVSIVVPARNEAGNIFSALERTPEFGTSLEFVFVEGHSSDNTWDTILQAKQKYPHLQIQTFQQSGKGKGDAVRLGYEKARGDLLMILDADLTVPPEDLPRFYDAYLSGKGDFINGTRLVYPMEKQAMRFLNYLGNKFFAWMLSAITGQTFKDTLCGTKVLRKSDYLKIAAGRKYFGDFDPFGDFDLLFGAAKNHLKILEIPIHYRDRVYGTTNISRFSHGWLLLKMTAYAARKFKFV